MPCAGIEEAEMITMRGKPWETQDGTGKDCYHIS